MTDLTTKTAQSLHEKWCEQMREKGWHGPDKDIENCTDKNYIDGMGAYHCQCDKFSPHLTAWDDLFESRRQEYLATAKAVLPEIVGEILDDAEKAVCADCRKGIRRKDSLHLRQSTVHKELRGYMVYCKGTSIRQLRVRRLEELE
ncbi:hypothetical protein LCGC14_2965260 [marine sediment metagenome]|uniref:Uncharacterized protein n=1 Tax=marine sediment metagenome TaxID=412755 RepID=A0A0F8XAZ3_9ZZZZ